MTKKITMLSLICKKVQLINLHFKLQILMKTWFNPLRISLCKLRPQVSLIPQDKILAHLLAQSYREVAMQMNIHKVPTQ